MKNDPAAANLVFRAERYTEDYPAFSGKPLTAQGYLESGSTFSCSLKTSVAKPTESNYTVYPNPAQHSISIQGTQRIERAVLFDQQGKSLFAINPRSEKAHMDLSSLAAGIYFLEVWTGDGHVKKEKIVVEKH